MMYKTFTDLPVEIAPYQSFLSDWSTSKRARPVGCPGGNEVIGTGLWSKWSAPRSSNSSAPALDLLFLSTWTRFLLLEMTSLIYPPVVFERPRRYGRTQSEVSCSNKASTHMSVLRRSKVWWARSDRSLPVRLPDNKLSEGFLGTRTTEVYMIFLLLCTQQRISRKMTKRGDNMRKRSPAKILHLTSHENSLHLRPLILLHAPKQGALGEG